MSKAILCIGYTEMVMDQAEAIKVFSMLNTKDMFAHETTWKKDETGDNVEIHKLVQFNQRISLKGMSEEQYAVWKLAGTV